jgi:hypothetical protein
MAAQLAQQRTDRSVTSATKSPAFSPGRTSASRTHAAHYVLFDAKQPTRRIGRGNGLFLVLPYSGEEQGNSQYMSFALDTMRAYNGTPQHDYLAALESAYSPQAKPGQSTTITHDGSQTQSTLPAVIVSLSPAARNALTNAQIALQVITGSLPMKASLPTAQSGDKREAITDAMHSAAPASTQVTMPSLEQIRSMSAADWFYDTTNVQDFTFRMAPDKAAAFEAAYNSKTLNIQRASDIPRLHYQDSWTYTASSAGSGMSSTFSFDSVWAGETYGSQCLVQSDPLFGGILVSWGDSRENSAS